MFEEVTEQTQWYISILACKRYVPLFKCILSTYAPCIRTHTCALVCLWMFFNGRVVITKVSYTYLCHCLGLSLFEQEVCELEHVQGSQWCLLGVWPTPCCGQRLPNQWPLHLCSRTSHKVLPKVLCWGLVSGGREEHQWQCIHMHSVCVCAHVHVVPIILQ